MTNPAPNGVGGRKPDGTPARTDEAKFERVIENLHNGITHRWAVKFEPETVPTKRAMQDRRASKLECHAEYNNRYTDAMFAFAQHLREDNVEIADNGTAQDAPIIKLRMFARQQLAEGMVGKALQRVEHSGTGAGGAIVTEGRLDVTGLSTAALAEIAALRPDE